MTEDASPPIDDAALDRLIGAAPLLALAVREEWRAAVRTHLGVSLRLGLLVAAFPLGDEAEPAPVFVA